MRRTITPSEVAKFEGVHRSTVWHWIKQGLIKNAEKNDSGEYKIPMTEYEKFRQLRANKKNESR